MPTDWKSIIETITDGPRLLALVALILGAFLLAIIAKAEIVEWYVVLLGIVSLTVVTVVVLLHAFIQSNRDAIQIPSEEVIQQPDTDRRPEGVVFIRHLLQKDRFLPNLIIGLSRGGLVVAARLSKELGVSPIVPTISLWPHLRDFDNALNSIDFLSIREMQITSSTDHPDEPWRILIVDDACRSGRSLEFAREYVKGKLDGVASNVKTAALKLNPGDHQIQFFPDYYVAADYVTDIWGDEER